MKNGLHFGAEGALREILGSGKVGLILGARQVGKNTQSEVDLVVKHGDALRAFEIKWSACRVGGHACHDAYGINVEAIWPDNPFISDPAFERRPSLVGLGSNLARQSVHVGSLRFFFVKRV